MRSDKGPWKDPDILNVSFKTLFLHIFFVTYNAIDYLGSNIIVEYMEMQMVQNGAHKCTKKPGIKSAEEKTISEDEIVFPKVWPDH